MEETSPDCHHPVCILAHELVNKLSTIVGHCDLSHDPGQTERQLTNHLAKICETAMSMAEKLNHHQCQLAFLARSLPSQEVPALRATHPEKNRLRLKCFQFLPMCLRRRAYGQRTEIPEIPQSTKFGDG